MQTSCEIHLSQYEAVIMGGGIVVETQHIVTYNFATIKKNVYTFTQFYNDHNMLCAAILIRNCLNEFFLSLLLIQGLNISMSHTLPGTQCYIIHKNLIPVGPTLPLNIAMNIAIHFTNHSFHFTFKCLLTIQYSQN